jgi:hydroxymethylglutaryl-CoA reductase (NADPH)
LGAATPERGSQQTGAELLHLTKYSFDPSILQGNIENFIGVAQVPIGVAGPLRINGEHARGNYFIPLATTEGALVASYNRGMRLLTECGGVKTTIVEQFMQRSPAFIFQDAASARAFGVWVDENLASIQEKAERQRGSANLQKFSNLPLGPSDT